MHPKIRPTTFIEAPRLGRLLGAEIVLASETFQLTGSFKFRAAHNVASRVPQRHLIAASSGNFGQALAYACALEGKSCTVVMPATSSKVKIDAVMEFGGKVELVDTVKTSRASRVNELAAEFPGAYVASAYDDPLVIEGNATLGDEIARSAFALDAVVAPVGGGGLTSGIVTGLRRSGKSIEVIGAEPALANDAARSFRAGKIIVNESEPQTLADGARTVSLGERNWEILREGLSAVVEVPEEKIREAVRALFSRANLKAEPTGALGVGAILAEPDRFRGRRICCVVSGGNVEPTLYAELISG